MMTGTIIKLVGTLSSVPNIRLGVGLTLKDMPQDFTEWLHSSADDE
jgi:hypothetical protein